VLADAGLTSEQSDEMYHLIAIDLYDDRFVVPTSGRENRDDVWAMKGSEGLAQGEMEERP
ncbi:MAG: nitrate reductase subunit beta, partial [Bilophila wadsworthia]